MEAIRGSFEMAEDGEHGVGGLAGMKKLGIHATELWMKLAFARLKEILRSILTAKPTEKVNPP
jgi:hypothetical protein